MSQGVMSLGRRFLLVVLLVVGVFAIAEAAAQDGNQPTLAFLGGFCLSTFVTVMEWK